MRVSSILSLSLVPARIEPLKDVDAVRGSKFNLTCVVHGDANDLQANWYHRPISVGDGSNSQWKLINQTCVLPASYGDAENAALAMASSSSTPPDVLANDLSACQKSAAGRFDSGVIFRQVGTVHAPLSISGFPIYAIFKHV